jgi:hypothetical protein
VPLLQEEEEEGSTPSALSAVVAWFKSRSTGVKKIKKPMEPANAALVVAMMCGLITCTCLVIRKMVNDITRKQARRQKKQRELL